MSSIDLNSIARPNTVSIFASDPAGISAFAAFFLVNTAVPVPNRVRLDLTNNVGTGRRATAARSPVEPGVASEIKLDPIMVSVSGTLSANPLGAVNTPLGAFGSAVRRDLKELKKLQKIQERREPVILVTYNDVFPSMAMSIDEIHDGSNKVDLTLTFEEIRIVSPLTVAGVLDLDSLGLGAGSTANTGPNSPTSVTAPSGVAGGLG